MVDKPFPEVGGVAGTAAVIEDLVRTSEVVDRAASLIDEAKTEIWHQRGILDAARAASTPATQRFLDNAEDALSLTLTRMQGSCDIANELWDVSQRLYDVATAYLAAERESYLHVSALTRASWAYEDAQGTGIWLSRHGLASLVDLGTPGIGVPFADALTNWIRPEGLPPSSGYLNGPTANWALGPIASTPWYNHITGQLATGTSLLEELFGEPRFIAVRERLDVEPMEPLKGLEDLVGGLQRVQHLEDGAVGIQTLTHGDGTQSYVLFMPGTSDASLDAGDPHDINGIFTAMSGGFSDSMRLAVEALAAAGVPAGANIMIAGYSQGGIGAHALASNDEFRDMYNVTHVSTVATPGDRFYAHPDTQYLSVENTGDAAPGTTGVAPIDQANVTTVLAEGPRDAQGEDYDPRTISGSHDLLTYAAIASYVDANPGTSTRAYLEGAQQYFDQGATSTIQVFGPVFPSESEH